jgi:very-short-patch-repair endonuclease
MKNETRTMHEGANPQIFRNAKSLRKSTTLAEQMLWHEVLRNKQLLGYKFRRQHPFNRYILDFYCHQLKLSIELDGKIHDKKTQKAYNEMRTHHLEEFGLFELRFKNSEVFKNIESVRQTIEKTINTLVNKT